MSSLTDFYFILDMIVGNFMHMINRELKTTYLEVIELYNNIQQCLKVSYISKCIA